MPRVSIGIPVYNAESYLELALQSLLDQTFEDFEILISDNASNDRTAAICRAFAARDRRIRYERAAENMGAARNYNRVFEMSSGAYFKWAAHDDYCAPTYLERCVEVLDGAPPGVVLSYPKTLVIDAAGATIPWNEEDLDLRQARPRDRLRHLLRNEVLCNPIFGVIRSAALRQTRLIGGYNSSDKIALAELALLGEFWEVPERLFYRRVHPDDSVTGKLHTPAVIAEWFDPNNRKRMPMPRGKLLLEHLRAVVRTRIGAAEKMACLRVVLSELFRTPRQWRVIGGEVKRVLWWRWRRG